MIRSSHSLTIQWWYPLSRSINFMKITENYLSRVHMKHAWILFYTLDLSICSFEYERMRRIILFTKTRDVDDDWGVMYIRRFFVLQLSWLKFSFYESSQFSNLAESMINQWSLFKCSVLSMFNDESWNDKRLDIYDVSQLTGA